MIIKPIIIIFFCISNIPLMSLTQLSPSLFVCCNNRYDELGCNSPSVVTTVTSVVTTVTTNLVVTVVTSLSNSTMKRKMNPR